MSDLIDEPSEGENTPEFTVTEISGAVKRTIEGTFGHVRVKGEIGRVSRPRSGHIYLDLKDDRNVLSGVIWKGVAARLAVQPEEGMEVVATGKLTTFGGQSKYQMVIEDIAPAGMGALMAMLEKRKAALAAEGLFAPERKRELPYLPEVIGVITSPSGAVIRDILHRLRDRFPRKVLIWPVAVQGKQCAPEVTRAIEGFNAMTPGGALPRPDLLIVARGGGSIEDLWGFNEEIVARAAAASGIPLISAVGHETDTTLIDYASDRRAPTPTAAAELAVPVRSELLAWVEEQGARLTRAATGAVDMRKQRLRDLSRALPRPESLLDSPRQRLDRATERLPAALTRAAQVKRLRLSEVSGSLRPATLMRRLDEARSRLADRAGRLNSDLLTRDIRRKKDAFEQISARLSRVATGQVEGWRNRLQALERIRQTLGYKETLNRGYAVVRGDGDVVTTAKAAKKAAALEIEFADGRYTVGAGAAPRKAKPKETPPDQGNLF
ncbi:exodeoxyribonuclease VII large subunit [Profundibacter amoris]|uniref:Exodeoxyribonuclease 7 large subunit n=1 Tax=Profundibacter amoris TaxID=2171755 RepID=A0A347UJ62_9RHOB|nr:exodeoxyribonuclease VII large subunit [Profundibacter amoris]AXX98890.1 exodeoxyribonuclease VII large subunit [Profundibacter amoris]